MYTYHGILLCNKKEWTMDTHNYLNKSRGNYTESKKSVPKYYILCDSIYIICFQWHTSGYQGLGMMGEGGWKWM